MKKIVVITTGGTIAMKYDPKANGLTPAVNGNDLIEAIPALKDIAEIEIFEFSNVPSGYITPHDMFLLAKTAERFAEREDICGIVITHGTDTIEETAYLLELTIKTTKPICITGAMRGASDTSPDGPGNLLAAVRTAVCNEAKEAGVLVVLNDEIHTAAEVVKTHTTNLKTFASPYWGPLGRVYADRVIFKRRPYNSQKIYAPAVVEDVHLLKTVAGMDASFFQYLSDRNAAGVVVESFGCGNVPPAVKRGIELLRKKNIPVILASRTHAGHIAPMYSYDGSAYSLLPCGVILSGDLSGPKCRIKLMLALAITRDNAKLSGYFNL